MGKSIRKIICTKCRLPPIYLHEQWITYNEMTFEANGSSRSEIGSGSSNTGNPFGVYAECSNGHRWRVKNASQITDLESKPQQKASEE